MEPVTHVAVSWLKVGQFLLEFTKVVLAIVAGLWAYHRFIRERIHAPQIEFNLDCTFLGPQEGAYVAEFKLNLLNKRAVRQEIYIINLRAFGISRDGGYLVA